MNRATPGHQLDERVVAAGHELSLVAIGQIKNLVDTLSELGLDPLHLHVDGHRPTDARPSIQLWMRYRTDFDAVCDRLGVPARKRVERGWPRPGQREWYAEHDTGGRRVLIQVVSFEHHPDWQPRDTGAAA